MTALRGVLFTFLGLFSTSLVFGADPNELGAEAFFTKESYNAPTEFAFAVGKGRTGVSIILVLKNLSNHALQVPTHSKVSAWGVNRRTLEILIGHNIGHTATGELHIRPDSELGLVTLRPGEGTQIEVQVMLNEDFDDKNIQVVYSVEPAFGSRYGSWSGRVSLIARDFNKARRSLPQKVKEKSAPKDGRP